MSNNYGAESIQILEGLEAVRKRPGMYIGSTSERGLHHLVWEIVDNSMDEALAGFCSEITINIKKDNIIQVIDNGRGIPVAVHPKTGKSTAETIFTVLHAGGKFDSDSYKVSGGLHGVGASVVNALSTTTKAIISRDGKKYEIEFSRGDTIKELSEVGTSESNGTEIIFQADPEIFTETTTYKYETLRSRVQQLAFLNRNIKININDYREDEPIENTYLYEGGIRQYVEYLNEGKETLNNNIIYCEGLTDGITIECGIQYNNTFATSLYSFTNNIHTHEGGTHEEGFRTSLTRVLSTYAKANKLLKDDEYIKGEDTREGLTCILSVKHPDPQFEGQTKTKLGNSEVRKITSQIIQQGIEEYLMENPNEAKKIIEKCILASRAREAARKAKDATRRKSPLDSVGFAAKLADCRSKKAEDTEIYIVEGDSAGGSAKQGRNSLFQAILPLRGKVLNVEKAREDKILENREILSLIQALGCGFSVEFDIEKIRYHKIVIMTDADVDGAHIRTLLLTFFFRFMKELIIQGYIYMAQPPLYKISHGKKVLYAYSDEELEEKMSSFEQKPTIQRYKGLGEMNPEQLWETTMDPESRTLLRVTVEDAVEADRVFSVLMGDEVAPRKKFINDNALLADNIDL